MSFRPITEFRYTALDPHYEFRCLSCGLGQHRECPIEVVVTRPAMAAGTYKCACRCKK